MSEDLTFRQTLHLLFHFSPSENSVSRRIFEKMNDQKQEVGGICLARGFVLCIGQLLLRFIIIIILEDNVKVIVLLLHNTKENRGLEV